MTQGLYGDADVIGLYQERSTLLEAVAEFEKDMGYKLKSVGDAIWKHEDEPVAWAWLEEVQ